MPIKIPPTRQCNRDSYSGRNPKREGEGKEEVDAVGFAALRCFMWAEPVELFSLTKKISAREFIEHTVDNMLSFLVYRKTIGLLG